MSRNFLFREVSNGPPPPRPSPSRSGPGPATLEEARVLLARNPRLLARIREEAEHIYCRSRNREDAPYQQIDYEHNVFRRRMAGQEPAAALLIAFEALAHFEKWLASDPRTWGAIRAAHEMAIISARAAATVTPTFNCAGLVGSLAAKGVALSVVDASIVATPAAALNDTDRNLIRTNKAAMISFLTTTESF